MCYNSLNVGLFVATVPALVYRYSGGLLDTRLCSKEIGVCIYLRIILSLSVLSCEYWSYCFVVWVLVIGKCIHGRLSFSFRKGAIL